MGPRDGLQSETQAIPAEAKAHLIEMLADSGLTTVEATSFVSPKAVPQMADAEEVFNMIVKRDDVTYPVLVPNMKGLEKALECGVQEIAVFAAASESFSQRNIGCSIKQSISNYSEVCRVAIENGVRVRGYVSCVLGCPYEKLIRARQVVPVADALYKMGCYEISLGDTIGIGTPGAAAQLIQSVKRVVPVENIAAHFHDTYGHALVNLMAVLQEGVSVVDSAVAGLGGCPFARGATGNVATEDVLYMLSGLGIHHGVDMHRVRAAGAYICDVLGRGTNSRVAFSIARREGTISYPTHYKDVLAAALTTGIISKSERNMLTQYRQRHNISEPDHNNALEALDWTCSEFEAGSRFSIIP